ncbi:RNA polymerase sigma factor [Thalassotalea litorea]|uniref:RNA polymerase sigma factor n=1 Tax=Thalassotalea litorea TaxID=2020715 RepID=UPI001485492A|nr:RNA polymerase sigma factor [Thalassotalea litorea]
MIEKAQANDQQSRAQIYKTYANACYTLAYRLCYEQMLAEDIVSEVFIKAFSQLHQFRFQGPFPGWLRRIVVHESFNKIKSERKFYTTNDEEILEIETTDLFSTNWLSACIDLDYLLKQLPPKQRAVMILHELEGFKHKEIAELFGKSESFSKTTLTRAYQSLKMMVTEQEQQHALK